MKPYIYSEKTNKLHNKGWSQEGENIRYTGNFSQYNEPENMDKFEYNNQKYYIISYLCA